MRLAVATLALLAQQCAGFMVPAFPSVSRGRGVVCAAEGPAASRGLTRGDALSRAALLIGGAGAAVFGKAAGAFAEGGQRYFDEKYRVSINVPDDWERADTQLESGQTSSTRSRRLTVYKQKSDAETAVFIAYTPMRPDLQKLTSFGGVADVAKLIVQSGPGIQSKLLKAGTQSVGAQPAYVFDYTIEQTGQPKRHLQTIFTLIPGDMLITYTAQCLDSDYEAKGPVLTGITKSFKIE